MFGHEDLRRPTRRLGNFQNRHTARSLAAKARALLEGRLHVSIEDVKAMAKPVLRHRIVTTYGAEAEGITTDTIV
ncbi:MAG: hypothetical protein ACO24Y_06110, partial [Hylemonella sp.]